jgi:hypothetical protein
MPKSQPVQAAHSTTGLLTDLALAALLGATTLYFAFHSGGYFPGATGLAAAEAAVLLAVRFAAGRRIWAGLSAPLAVAALAFVAFALWTLASSRWSHAPHRALTEFDRALLYSLTLALFGSLTFSIRRIRWMLYALAGAIVVICSVAFISRTLPGVIHDVPPIHPERLSYPLTYWNSLGLLAALGIILCGHLACSTRDPWPARVLGAAAVPLLAATLYFTFSRGATWVAVGAVALYAVLGRPRALVTGFLATFPATAAAVIAANPPGPLTGKDPTGPAAIATGNRIALTVLACVVGAALVRGLLIPVDSRLDRLRLPDRGRRPVIAIATGLFVALVFAGCATLKVPDLVQDKYREFSSSDARAGGAGGSRLLSAANNGRQAHWDVALDSYGAHPTRGEGAGTYGIAWQRQRPNELQAEDAHSLYLEVLAELGWPGLLALGTGLLVILGAFTVRARGPDRALFAALAAAALAWGVRAGVDWDWEMPVLTLWLFAFGGAALASGRERRAERLVLTVPLRVVLVAGGLALAIVPGRVAISEARLSAGTAALKHGDCVKVRADARSALEVVREQPRPHEALAFCDMRERRYAAAARQYRLALRSDPESWKLHYGLAISRAAAGRDPRRAARRLAGLNPREKLVRQGLPALLSGDRGVWRRAGRAARVLLP